jgi:hypothetical protein
MRDVDTSNNVITLPVDWSTYPLNDPHQVTASRRSRTEARARRMDDAKKGLTNRGPLQKPAWESAFTRVFNALWRNAGRPSQISLRSIRATVSLSPSFRDGA